MFQRILVPIDGSRSSLEAVLYTLPFVKAFGSHVILLYVISPDIRAAAEKGNTGNPRTMADEIMDIAKRALLRKRVTTKDVVLEGPPAPRICAAMMSEKCDLVIMGSRGISNVPDFLMGSVSSKVSQFARGCVLVVRDPTPLRSFLIAYDGSRISQRALELAGEMAIRFKVKVHLITVAREGDESSGLELIRGAKILEWHLKMVNAGLDVKMDLRTGHPAETVVRLAASEKADLVVLGGTGSGGSEDMGLGSVSDQVLRHCPCSVLAVK